MRKSGATFQLSASDLVGHLNCRHLTVLDRAVAEGALAKPKIWDPLLQILAERGSAHERTSKPTSSISKLQALKLFASRASSSQTRRLLPRACGLLQMAGGSASALTLSRPAQASRMLRPAGSLSSPGCLCREAPAQPVTQPSCSPASRPIHNYLGETLPH